MRGTSNDEQSNCNRILVNYSNFYNEVPIGASVLIDDGDLELVVTDKKDGDLICEVANDGVIKGRKSVNVPDVKIDLPSLTERDRMFINWAIDNEIDFIAHSFVRSAKDVLEVQQILDTKASNIKIISKIENREGVDNIDEILDVTYGIMVARGDLGVEIPAEQIPEIQRDLVKKCIESKKPVIIATQMLHSMISSPRPT
jgi:pyruvate kinase